MTDLEEALALLAAPCIDERFFQRALKALALVTQCRWAAFARPSIHRGKIEVVAFCDVKQTIPGFEFELMGSPCEAIYQMRYPNTHLLYANDLQQRFPDFQLIKDLGAVSYQAELILDDEGGPIGHILVMDTLPQRENTKSREFFRLLAQRIGIEYKRLLMSRELSVHKEMIASTHHMMSFVGLDYRYHVVSKGYEHLLNCDASQIIGKHASEIHGKAIFETHLKPLLDRSFAGESINTQTRIHPPSVPEPQYLNVHHNPHQDENGRISGVIVSAHNITELHKAKEQSEYLAFHDSLTQLPNRLALFNHFADLLSRLNQSQAELAVLYLDLDDFKLINDNYNHLVGDKVLQKVAEILRKVCPEAEMVARIGGDEFIILHSFDAQDESDKSRALSALCQSLNQMLDEGINHEGDHLRLAASIGCHWVEPDQRDVSALICLADKSMYRNKRRKRLNEARQ
ncbi:sensor domain-containing diguanylate cyclase [Shewanella sp. KCT]|uniref:sensor domain-containing diguanylate cyclase n=1 Tax=Shewanella sp. KCT TaxID=2569535 RepID=UPI0011844DB4|nr:sensor domain-containing diguanylate cyclase [Shewanella sp. KCT]TVP15970.1 diguanylate cyclase [Shewanella sp. KCT]